MTPNPYEVSYSPEPFPMVAGVKTTDRKDAIIEAQRVEIETLYKVIDRLGQGATVLSYTAGKDTTP